MRLSKLNRTCATLMLGIPLTLAAARVPDAAAQTRPAAHKSPSALAADVARAMRDYRAVLERSLPGYEAVLREATDVVQERRALHAGGLLSAAHVEEAERHWLAAHRDLHEAREAIDEAERIIAAATLQEQLSRLAPLPRGGYQETATLVRFNGGATWSLRDVARLDEPFTRAFGRPLPISSYGQTKVHDRLGLDHRHAVDVAVHPDSAEGRWLMERLRREGVPFIGVRGAMAGSSTGAHVHVGAPSPRLGSATGR